MSILEPSLWMATLGLLGGGTLLIAYVRWVRRDPWRRGWGDSSAFYGLGRRASLWWDFFVIFALLWTLLELVVASANAGGAGLHIAVFWRVAAAVGIAGPLTYLYVRSMKSRK